MSSPNDINALRLRHEAEGLDESELADDPFEMFHNWFNVAQELVPGAWLEPNAMTLSTSDGAGDVSGRIVLLKKIDAHGFYFFTNYGSDKGKQLLQCPRAALTFHWPYLGRQVRITGSVEKTAPEISAEYFHSRPRGSQISAVASDQSCVIKNRAQLEARFAEIEQKYVNQEIPLPDYWGGFVLVPDNIEFWQGRDNRMHDRLKYSRKSATTSQWIIHRLAP